MDVKVEVKLLGKEKWLRDTREGNKGEYYQNHYIYVYVYENVTMKLIILGLSYN
jgi:hypothetical protein